MTLSFLTAVAVSCAVLSPNWGECVAGAVPAEGAVAGISTGPFDSAQGEPKFTGTSLDVVITAQSALVWDVATGKILYEKNADTRRPIASLTKLASVLVLRDVLPLTHVVPIPLSVRAVQRQGAHIRLPVGQHARVADLMAASLIPSANDAMVTLATAASGSEAEFVQEVNVKLPQHGIHNTKLSNATGLSGGEQYSTAADVRTLLSRVWQDEALQSYLSATSGTLRTQEGVVRTYKTTNELLGTYLPVVAAKTGYTREAGQNLALITQTDTGKRIGAVVLGSEERFQDMKILVEWIVRNYTW